MENQAPKARESRADKVQGCVFALIGVPLAIVGGFFTVVLCIFLGSYVITRIGGGPPVREIAGFMIVWLFVGVLPLAFSVVMLKRRPGLPVSYRVVFGFLLLLLVLGVDSQCGPKNWHAPFRRAKVVTENASRLKRTIVTPLLDVVLQPGTNLLWCGTFQLAWNELSKVAGGNSQLLEGNGKSALQNPMAAALNRSAFTKDCIDESSYVAMAGCVRDNLDQRITSAVKEKFHGSFEPRLLPQNYTTGRPQDLMAYACLWKKLSYQVPFERLDDSFRFGSEQVRAFGIGRTQAPHEGMYAQVQILDYQGPTNFVVELKTAMPGDQLILAMVEPKGSLGETVSSVRQRVANTAGQPAGTNDILIVPRIAFDLVREYTELEKRWLVPTATNVASDLLLLSAMQSIKFEMNEKGVELLSEAHMAFGCSMEPEPAREHVMIFNKPFLLLLQRNGAPMPYSAMWVDNPELMVKW